MENMTRDVAAGALGGLAGGAVLTGAMLMAERMGIEKITPPAKVGRWAAYHAGADPKSLKGEVTAQEEAMAEGGHLVASAALGAAFGAMRARYELPAVPTGLAFGLGLYALNFGLVGPALTITRKPWNVPPSRHAERALLHAAFGLVLGLVAHQFTAGSRQGDHRRAPQRPGQAQRSRRR